MNTPQKNLPLMLSGRFINYLNFCSSRCLLCLSDLAGPFLKAKLLKHKTDNAVNEHNWGLPDGMDSISHGTSPLE